MKAAALNLLHRAHLARLENRLDQARTDLVAALDICRQAGVKADTAFALKRLGQIERDRQNREAALRHYEEAAAIYRERGDALNLAHTIRHVGDLHQDAGRAVLAAPCYEEAVDLYRRLRNQARRGDVANAIRSMALHKEQAGEIERARLLWIEARDLYASLDNPLRRIFRRRPNPGVVESSQHLARLARQPARSDPVAHRPDQR
jgi:tetratricopeptide (TPR) repeat protein